MSNLKFNVRVDSNNNIEASSKKELMKLQASVMADTSARKEEAELKDKYSAVLKAGFDTEASVKFAAAFAGELSEQINREGFLRSIFVEKETQQGSAIVLDIKRKQSVAVVATGPGIVRSQRIQDKFLYPSEFTISYSAIMSKSDLARSSSDRVAELYDEGLEAIMVQEDRTAKKLIDRMLADSSAEVELTAAELTPKDVATGLTYISDHGGAPAIGLFSYTVWADVMAGTYFSDFFNPIANMELVKTGRLGELYGVMVLTDAARAGNLKVLNPGEMYILNRGDLLGAYTDRYGLESAEINGINQIGGSMSARGWNVEELMSMAVFNDKGAYKIIKV